MARERGRRRRGRARAGRTRTPRAGSSASSASPASTCSCSTSRSTAPFPDRRGRSRRPAAKSQHGCGGEASALPSPDRPAGGAGSVLQAESAAHAAESRDVRRADGQRARHAGRAAGSDRRRPRRRLHAAGGRVALVYRAVRQLRRGDGRGPWARHRPTPCEAPGSRPAPSGCAIRPTTWTSCRSSRPSCGVGTTSS